MGKFTNQFGVTLVELLIAVAIMGILASVAYPSYVDYVARSNRAEAQRELVRLANLQEQRFIDQRAYTNNMQSLGLGADPFITESGNYSIDAAVPANGLSFVLTATAKNQQENADSSCSTLTINEVGQKSAESAHCWEQ